MYKSESIQEKETRKILWSQWIQTDHQIATRTSDFMLINEKNLGESLVLFGFVGYLMPNHVFTYISNIYLPNPSARSGGDMTQGQFLSRV